MNMKILWVNAMMLVHFFSQSNEWFEDYAAFVSLMGVSLSENAMVSMGTHNGVLLHLAWVNGDIYFLTK